MGSVYVKEGFINHLWDINTLSSYSDVRNENKDLFFGLYPLINEGILFTNNINKVNHNLGFLRENEISFHTNLTTNKLTVLNLSCDKTANFNSVYFSNNCILNFVNVNLTDVYMKNKMHLGNTNTNTIYASDLTTQNFISQSMEFQSLYIGKNVHFDDSCNVNNMKINNNLITNEGLFDTLNCENINCDILSCGAALTIPFNIINLRPFTNNFMQNSLGYTNINNIIHFHKFYIDKINNSVLIDNSCVINSNVKMETIQVNGKVDFFNVVCYDSFMVKHKAFLNNVIINNLSTYKLEQQYLINISSDYHNLSCENTFVNSLSSKSGEINSINTYNFSAKDLQSNTIVSNCAFINKLNVNKGYFHNFIGSNLYINSNIFASKLQFDDVQIVNNNNILSISDCIFMNSDILTLSKQSVLFNSEVHILSKSKVFSIDCNVLTSSYFFLFNSPISVYDINTYIKNPIFCNNDIPIISIQDNIHINKTLKLQSSLYGNKGNFNSIQAKSVLINKDIISYSSINIENIYDISQECLFNDGYIMGSLFCNSLSCLDSIYNDGIMNILHNSSSYFNSLHIQSNVFFDNVTCNDFILNSYSFNCFPCFVNQSSTFIKGNEIQINSILTLTTNDIYINKSVDLENNLFVNKSLHCNCLFVEESPFFNEIFIINSDETIIFGNEITINSICEINDTLTSIYSFECNDLIVNCNLTITGPVTQSHTNIESLFTNEDLQISNCSTLNDLQTQTVNINGDLTLHMDLYFSSLMFEYNSKPIGIFIGNQTNQNPYLTYQEKYDNKFWSTNTDIIIPNSQYFRIGKWSIYIEDDVFEMKYDLKTKFKIFKNKSII